jgi:hypothetical protein
MPDDLSKVTKILAKRISGPLKYTSAHKYNDNGKKDILKVLTKTRMNEENLEKNFKNIFSLFI